MYLIYGAVGAVTGQLILNWRYNYWAERDAVFRHYITLHPEDFPPPGRLEMHSLEFRKCEFTNTNPV